MLSNNTSTENGGSGSTSPGSGQGLCQVLRLPADQDESASVWLLRKQVEEEAALRIAAGEAGSREDFEDLGKKLKRATNNPKKQTRLLGEYLDVSTRRRFLLQSARYALGGFVFLTNTNADGLLPATDYASLALGQRCEDFCPHSARLLQDATEIAKRDDYSFAQVQRILPLVDWSHRILRLGKHLKKKAPKRYTGPSTILENFEPLQVDLRFLRHLLGRCEERRTTVAYVGSRLPTLLLGDRLLARYLASEAEPLRIERAPKDLSSALAAASENLRKFVRLDPSRCQFSQLADAADLAELTDPWLQPKSLLWDLLAVKTNPDPAGLHFIQTRYIRYFGFVDIPKGRVKYIDLLLERIDGGWYEGRPYAALGALANVLDICRRHPVELREHRKLIYDRAGRLGGGQFRAHLERYEAGLPFIRISVVVFDKREGTVDLRRRPPPLNPL